MLVLEVAVLVLEVAVLVLEVGSICDLLYKYRDTLGTHRL